MLGIKRRLCKNLPNKFCYECGGYLMVSQGKPISGEVQKAYLLYFDCKRRDQVKTCAQYVYCISCSMTLNRQEVTEVQCPLLYLYHIDECYFNLTNTVGF